MDGAHKHHEERSRPDLRDAILRASLEIGSEHGEDGLTMRAIASRLGLSVTALYLHYDGKPAILRALRLWGAEMLAHELAPAHEHADPVVRLLDESVRYVEWAISNPWLYRLIFQEEEIDWRTFSEAERERMMEPNLRTHRAFQQAVEQGQFRKDVDTETGPFLMWAANHGLATLILGGRISERHPVFPVRDQKEFILAFARGVVRGFA